MEKVTEKYLVERLKKLEEENQELIQQVLTLNIKNNDLSILKSYFKIDDEEPKRIACVDADGRVAGSIVWQGYDGYERLREILLRK